MSSLRSLLLLLAAAAAAAPLAGATSSTALGGAFQDIGDGTRPLGMGGAFVAIADDANATQENPAGMGFFGAKDHFATFTHSDLFNLGILSRDFVAYAQGDTGFGAVGLSWDRLSANLSPNQYSEDEIAYSGAKQLLGLEDDAWPKLSIGWQLKYLRVDSDFANDTAEGLTVGNGTASGYGTSVGALLKLRPSLSFGLMLQDLYSSLNWATGTLETVPLTARAGLSYKLMEDTLFAAEARGQQGSGGVGLSSLHTGLEHWVFDGKEIHWGLLQNIGLRVGYYDLVANEDGGVLTAGASVKAQDWEIDYTFEYGLSSSNELGNTQRFGLGLQF